MKGTSARQSRGGSVFAEIRRLRKKGFDPMTGVDAKQTNTVVRLAVDPNGNRLDTWKEIAVYLGREVRTVQRWEKREALPVHRHAHLRGSTVYAFKSEIDAWLASRSQTFSEHRPMQKRLKHSANRLDLSSQVMGQMFEVFRLWLAVIERESCQSFGETVVPDLTLAPHHGVSSFKGREVSAKFGHDNS